MTTIRLCILVFGLLFLSGGSDLFAHEIQLKSGSIIKTNYINRSGSQLTYEQFGGMVTIPLSEVERITYNGTSAAKGSRGAQISVGSGSRGRGALLILRHFFKKSSTPGHPSKRQIYRLYPSPRQPVPVPVFLSVKMG